ncbi:MAG TPA: hypothetical protein VFT45_19215 [Longimicrobium sp.]|nr:hypothetical protein [Longimicrobium sp.]
MPTSRSVRTLIPLLLLVMPRPAAAQRWVSVDVGTGHTCALDSRGRAFCWGTNHHGELGARTPDSCAPSHHGHGNTCWASPSRQPIAVGGGTRFRSVSAGGNASCGLDTEGRAWCWGKNVGSAREGCGSGEVCSFDPQPFAPEMRFSSLRVGEDGVCGITTAGAGHCWRPVRGQREWAMTDVAPGQRLAWMHQYADWMDTGQQSICAVTVDGSAFCQGPNRFAQLGTGDTVPRVGAARVASAARFVRVHPEASSACGLTAEGAAECWGAAERRPSWPGGAPSNPSFFACTMGAWCSGPRAVAPGVRFVDITWVRDRFCGVDAAGQAHCWEDDGVPVRVAEGVRFTALEGGETHACGLAREGAIWCWGQDVNTRTDLAEVVRAPDPPH